MNPAKKRSRVSGPSRDESLIGFSVPYCKGCFTHCCGDVEGFRPVLMPWERSESYFGLTESRGKLTLIKQRTCGVCVFHYRGVCGIYDKRPVECRLYPFIVDFTGGVRLELDPRASCMKLTLTNAKDDLLSLFRGKKIPTDWVRAYVFFQKGLRAVNKEEKKHGAAPL